MRSITADLDGPVHYVRTDGPADGPAFVLVHGLGGSHTNWVGIADALARMGTVYAVDLVGFGRTPLEGRSAGVGANRGLLQRFIQEVVGKPAVVMGNSMGGLIAAMLAASNPELVAGLVLIGPALPRSPGQMGDRTVAGFFAAYMVPKLGQSLIHRRMRALGPERLVEETLRLCMADASDVRPDILEAQIAMARERIEMPWATAAFLEGARSIVQVLARRKRVMTMLREISAPTLLIMGAKDRLVPIAAARMVARVRPDWDFEVFDELGHTPMMEDPRAFMAAVEAWLHGPASWLLTGRQSLLGQARSPLAAEPPSA